MTADEADKAGPCCYCGHDGPVLPWADNECQTGHLARYIYEHDKDQPE